MEKFVTRSATGCFSTVVVVRNDDYDDDVCTYILTQAHIHSHTHIFTLTHINILAGRDPF